jgi:cobalt-zinc-cadmium efflux system outer membrane protein
MNMRMTPAVLIATLLGGAPAFAQRPAAPAPLAQRFLDLTKGLSLDQAVALALEQEPSLRAARSQIDVAEGMRQQASLKPNPSLTFERREEPSGTDNQTMVAVQWPLDLWRRRSRVAVAEREVTTTRLAVADRERVLAAEVRARYGDLAIAIRDLAVLDEIVAATRRQHDLLRSRADEGASPPLERDLLDVELRRLESERLLQAGRAEAASFGLKRVLGLAADATLTIRDALEDLVRRDVLPAPEAEHVSAVVAQRADVREAAARLDVAEAQIDRAADIGRLDVSLFGNYMRMDAGFPQRAFGAGGDLTRIRGLFHYVSVGAMVTIPVLDRNQGAVAAARAERAGAAAALEAATLSAEAELAAARARHEHAQRAVQVYTDGARTLARQNLTVVSQTYELGRLTVFDVMSEQRRYLDVERAYTQTLREAYEARTALDRARGERR